MAYKRGATGEEDFAAPEGSPVSADYAVTVEGKESAVYGVPSTYKTPACFSPFDTTGPVTIDVTVKFLPGDKQITNVSISGVRYGDTLVVKAEDMGLKRNAFVSDVRFEDGTPAKSAPKDLRAQAVSE